MSNNNWQKVETIVDQALELPKAKRQPFVEQKCKDKPELKREVTQLLASIFDSEGWLENPAEYKNEFYNEVGDDIETLARGRSLIGQKVGDYIITEELGTGGMGSVYLAERSKEDFDHQVAIKIIRDNRATPSNIQRFKREQQILANLNHPNIARFFDGGITNGGTPYIIMEYIDGVPVDEYCKREKCSVSGKVALFKQILHAIRHAHENLVIHRDLKPNNILVDDTGAIKILDFGISKLLRDENDLSITKTDTQLLTPRYAAPEQVKETNITTATDLYTLGVIFHELLTSTPLIEVEDKSRREVENQIISQDFHPPSRLVESKKTKNRLRGDLDEIILKAIRKEPNKRYRVANEFLDDLTNYEKGLPVSARDDSFRYRSQKFIKRHTKGIATAVGILLLILGFSGFYTWRIAQERDIAQREAQKATQIKNLFGNILQQQSPYSQSDREITLNEALDKGTDNMQQSLNEQPHVKAELLGILADNYISLGEYKKAERLVKQALSLYESSNLKSAKRTYVNNLKRLGSVYHRIGSFDKAKKTFLKAIDKTNDSFNKSSLKASLLNSLALVFSESGNLKKSEDHYRKAMQAADSSQKVTIMSALGNLSRIYANQGKYKKAIELEKESIRNIKKIYPALHPNIASGYNSLAFTYQQMGKLKKADSLHQIALGMRRKLFKPDHPHIASSLVRLGLLKIKQFHTQEAEQYFKEGYEILSSKLPEDHWQVLSAKGGLAISRAMQGAFQENIPILEKVYHQFCEKFGTKDWRSLKAASALNNLYRLWGKPKKAKPYASEK